jgi:hypothetical protein
MQKKRSHKTGGLLNLKRGSNHMKFSMTVQEKCDLLIQVTAWAGSTVHLSASSMT